MPSHRHGRSPSPFSSQNPQTRDRRRNSIDVVALNLSPSEVEGFNNLVRQFFYKVPLIIITHRLPPASSNHSLDHAQTQNESFGLVLPDCPQLLTSVSRWLRTRLEIEFPPPLILELYLDLAKLPQGQSLVVEDRSSARRVVEAARNHSSRLVLERWEIRLNPLASPQPFVSPSASELKARALVKTLFTSLGLDQVSHFCRQSSAFAVLKPQFRVLTEVGLENDPLEEEIGVPIFQSSRPNMISTPIGDLVARPIYQANCNIKVERTESILSAQILDSETEVFHPTIPSSLPSYRDHLRGGTRKIETPPDRPSSLAANFNRFSSGQGGDIGSPSIPFARPPSQLAQPSFSSLRSTDSSRRYSISSPSPALGPSASPAGSARTPAFPIQSKRNSFTSTLPQSVPRNSVGSIHAANSVSGTPSGYESVFAHRRQKGGGSLGRRDTHAGHELSSAPSSAHQRPSSFSLTAQRNSLDHSAAETFTDDSQLRELIQLLDLENKRAASFGSDTSQASKGYESHRVNNLLTRFWDMKDEANAIADNLSKSMLAPRRRSLAIDRVSYASRQEAPTSTPSPVSGALLGGSSPRSFSYQSQHRSAATSSDMESSSSNHLTSRRRGSSLPFHPSPLAAAVGSSRYSINPSLTLPLSASPRAHHMSSYGLHTHLADLPQLGSPARPSSPGSLARPSSSQPEGGLGGSGNTEDDDIFRLTDLFDTTDLTSLNSPYSPPREPR